VESVLDFSEMYRRVGVSRDQDILAVVNAMPEPRRSEAHAAIAAVETEALQAMVLTSGALQLGAWCAARGIPMGLVTRNTASSVAFFHDKHWSPRRPFSPAVARDHGLEHKPHPAALLHCSSVWGVDPSCCVMIGDSPRDDIVAGRRAGMLTILLAGSTGRLARGANASAVAAQLDGERVPHATAESLDGVPALLEQLFQVCEQDAV